MGTSEQKVHNLPTWDLLGSRPGQDIWSGPRADKFLYLSVCHLIVNQLKVQIEPALVLTIGPREARPGFGKPGSDCARVRGNSRLKGEDTR
jgi:hypothetical protein